jgi:hypothetical protein
MRKTLSAIAVLIAGMALLGTSSAWADTTLLSLVNPPTTTGTPYGPFSFNATSSTTTISIGGYDHPGFEYVWDISVTLGGGANLLGPSQSQSWARTPAQSGSEAAQSSGLLTFGDLSSGNYATFTSQPFATTPGDTYLLSFQFANELFPNLPDGPNPPPDPSKLVVTTSGGFASTPAVPELTTWIMALLGFVGLGLVGYCQGRKTQSRTRAA